MPISNFSLQTLSLSTPPSNLLDKEDPPLLSLHYISPWLLMAVEARHLNLFPSQFVQEREVLMNPSHDGQGIYPYSQQHMRLPAIPFTAVNQSLFQQLVCESKTSINSESGLTCNVPPSRKRSRDSGDEFYGGGNFPAVQKSNGGCQFFGENIMPQIQQYQLEIDAVICEHTKKMRLELQQRQKQQAKALIAAIGESMAETLREKEDEIQKMARLNLILQEKVKSLYVENQLWREMAQTNEAEANSLRTDLQHALAQYGAAAEEVESCGSSDHGREIEAPYKAEARCGGDRCRRCGERQSSVLLLPCRHLCLCSVCGSGSHHLQACPVCNSSMTATLHVNMS